MTDYADDTDLSRSKGICQLSESGFSGFGDVQDKPIIVQRYGQDDRNGVSRGYGTP
ncbi:MAG: hypothetical protein LW630_09385 [Saprospiraceae bacterium]|nr:hypothetical protein [Saprospiraceae bacterium]